MIEEFEKLLEKYSSNEFEKKELCGAIVAMCTKHIPILHYYTPSAIEKLCHYPIDQILRNWDEIVDEINNYYDEDINIGIKHWLNEEFDWMG